MPAQNQVVIGGVDCHTDCHTDFHVAVALDPVGAECCVVSGQAAFRYSLMSPPQRAVFTAWR